MKNILSFKDISVKDKKTFQWIVLGNNDTWLGDVKWYAPWRKYCFFPVSSTLFDSGCLNQISFFCKTATEIHKNKEIPKKLKIKVLECEVIRNNGFKPDKNWTERIALDLSKFDD